MKSRKVFVSLEIETELSIKALREKAVWMRPQAVAINWAVEQVHVNIAKPRAQNMQSSRKPWFKPRKLAKKA